MQEDEPKIQAGFKVVDMERDSALFDGGTGEVAKMATQSKPFSDKLKSLSATKCYLNDC